MELSCIYKIWNLIWPELVFEDWLIKNGTKHTTDFGTIYYESVFTQLFFLCAGAQQTMLIWAKNSTLLKSEIMSLICSSLMMTNWGGNEKQPLGRFCRLSVWFSVFSTLGAEKLKLIILDNTCLISIWHCMTSLKKWMIIVCFLAQ